ncbi:Peptide-methionine (S)-S-oxide reductase [Bertholletia excelsa]
MATEKSNKAANPAQNPDMDLPDEGGLEFAQFAAGCFWGVEKAFLRVEGVVKTEVGYSQGDVPDPDYMLVCSGTTNHAEVVRIQFDPSVCPYTTLLSIFWGVHDPTSLHGQDNSAGTQYRSGIYYYNEEQARLAGETMEAMQRKMETKKIVTEILPAKTFYRAEEYHQQYLLKNGGACKRRSSAGTGCTAGSIPCFG